MPYALVSSGKQCSGGLIGNESEVARVLVCTEKTIVVHCVQRHAELVCWQVGVRRCEVTEC